MTAVNGDLVAGEQAALAGRVEAMRRRMGWGAGGGAVTLGVLAFLAVPAMLRAADGDPELVISLIYVLPVAAAAPPIALAMAYKAWYRKQVFGWALARRGATLRMPAAGAFGQAIFQESGLLPERVFQGRYRAYSSALAVEGHVDGLAVSFCHLSWQQRPSDYQPTSGLFVAISLEERVGEQVVVVPKGAELPEAASDGLTRHPSADAAFSEHFDAYASGPVSAQIALPPERLQAFAALAARHPGLKAVFRKRSLFVLVPWAAWDGFAIGLTVPVERLTGLEAFEAMVEAAAGIVRAVASKA